MSNITTLQIKLKTKILHIIDSLNEIKKTLPKENKKELKRIKEKIESYQKELEEIEIQIDNAEYENEMNQLTNNLIQFENKIKINEKINKYKREIIEQLKLLKSKWEITIDVMMIIGKYFKSNNDYINIMKVNKKYNELVEMYYFNLINDYELFKNMKTQHFYKSNTK